MKWSRLKQALVIELFHWVMFCDLHLDSELCTILYLFVFVLALMNKLRVNLPFQSMGVVLLLFLSIYCQHI